jgi:1-acyl-sn-glycerol-3-phosphate acyltransferase
LHLLGWREVGNIRQDIKKAVVVLAPHTSNWDGFYALLFCFGKKIPIRFAIKKEVMFFPLGLLLKRMGAIPIDRKRVPIRSGGMVQVMADMFQQEGPLMLAIAPEGTRKRAARWKMGFYHIALQAKVPIILGYLDYAKREVGVSTVFYPTGKADEDLQEIKAIYKGKMGKYPEQGV